MFEAFIAAILVLLAILAALLVRQARNQRERVKTSVVARLLDSVSHGALSVTDLGRLRRETGLSVAESKDVAIRAYSVCYRHALENPKLRAQLADIRTKLRLADEDRDLAEAQVQRERYVQAWSKIAGSGLPTNEALETLQFLQKDLGITKQRLAHILGSKGVHLFRSAYKKWLLDGTDFAYVQRLKTALGLDDRTAAQAVLADAIENYRNAFRKCLASPQLDLSNLNNLRIKLGLDEHTAMHATKEDAIAYVEMQCEGLLRTGVVSIADRDRLAELLSLLKLDESDLSARWRQLARLILLESLRGGELPRINVRIALRGGEICHYRDTCTFTWRSPKGGWRSSLGELFLSNQRLIFASDEVGRSFEVKLPSIVDIAVDAQRGQGLQVRCTANRGTGTYVVPDNDMLDATFAGVLKLDHSPVLRSRGIPSFVKQQVWTRDEGRCVLCGCAEDIHYDHDIPFSKGGANTVENIRLLCARCNLQKRDRIE
jgi:hypothetical protein